MQCHAGGPLPDGKFLSRPNGKNQLTLQHGWRMCLINHSLRPESLAFLPNAQLGWGGVAPMHHVQFVGPHIDPQVAHPLGWPDGAVHTNPCGERCSPPRFGSTYRHVMGCGLIPLGRGGYPTNPSSESSSTDGELGISIEPCCTGCGASCRAIPAPTGSTTRLCAPYWVALVGQG